MKKLLKGLVCALLLVFTFTFVSFNVKAAATNESEVKIEVTGARIRKTGDKQGLRFEANINTLEAVTEHGFYIAIGNHTKAEFETAINANATVIGENALVKKMVVGEQLNFNAVIFGIPEENYKTNISTVAYAKVGEKIHLSTTECTRNIAEIAKLAYENSDNPGEFITDIYHKTYSTIVKPNGELTIAQAIANLPESGGTICLLPGTYNEKIVIDRNNVTITSYNDKIDPNTAKSARNEEAIMDCDIVINASLKNIKFSGLKFIGNHQILNKQGPLGTSENPVDNIDNFIFSYNIVESTFATTTGFDKGKENGFICFYEDGKSYANHVKILNNYFTTLTGYSATSVICFSNTKNLEVKDNVFENIIAKGQVLIVEDAQKGASGEYTTITHNKFLNIAKTGIDLEWMSHLPSNSKNAKINLDYNEFDGIGNNCIFLGGITKADNYLEISLSHNKASNFARGFFISTNKASHNYKVNYNTFVVNKDSAFAVKLSFSIEKAKLNAKNNTILDETNNPITVVDKYYVYATAGDNLIDYSVDQN